MGKDTTEDEDDVGRRKREARIAAAIDGLDVAVADDIARIRDGIDVWLCRAAEWHRALDAARAGIVELSSDDAEDDLAVICKHIAGPVLPLHGVARGTVQQCEELIRGALAAELISERQARHFTPRTPFG